MSCKGPPWGALPSAKRHCNLVSDFVLQRQIQIGWRFLRFSATLAPRKRFEMIKLRVVLAGVLSGIVLFLWLTVAHMATPLGYAGIGQLSSEKAVTDTLKANIPDAGFYFFPGMGVPFDAPRAQRQAAMPAYLNKYAAGPVGILVYRPVGGAMMTAGQLTAELLNNILQGLALAMILALLASHTIASGAYVGFAAGICAATATNVSYWNWYGFPANFTAAAIVTELIGYVLMGMACGWLLKRLARKVAA
jgi:hypothetical protein